VLAQRGVASAVLLVACAGCGTGTSKGGGGGPTDRIVLFDGSNFDEWKPEQGDGQVPWQLVDDGSMLVVSGTGNVVSRQAFESVFVHIEYKTPTLPVDVTGRERGNSGVYLKGTYEMQILDSFGRPPEIDGAGSLYGVRAPLVNSCHEQARWNTYEIEFVAPSYDADTKLTNGRVTAHLNGELVQDDTEVSDTTDPARPETSGPGPLLLQEHQNGVSFRNIWVIPR